MRTVMRRREFLHTGALSLMTGFCGRASAADTAALERRRLETLAEANRSIRNCFRRHLITSYLPFHAMYNLGEYPCRKPWDPGAWDEQQLDELSASGVQLIQVHEEWNDAQRLFGGDKFSPLNRRGFTRFVNMVHARRMKLIVYVSTGYFERNDPDFRPEWARGNDLVELWYHYARCSPASPGWRAYLLPRIRRILDEFGVDGLYNDLGYLPLYRTKPASDDVPAFEESASYDGALEDLLGLIYAEVKRRGGIVKVHRGGASQPNVRSRVYDYLWVGEGANNADVAREAVRGHTPYVVPCLDMSRAHIESEDELYLHAIPYMQFPILLAGRPFTGERAAIPGIQYKAEEKDFWTRHARAIWRHYQANPRGPYSYGWWDSCPGRPKARATYFKWLKVYRPMVVEGTWAYLEVRDSDLFANALPGGVVASVFANSKMYLVLANYSHSGAVVTTRNPFRDSIAGGTPAASWTLPARSLRILES
ncbi:MAG: hypothetical protein HUU41_09435 [Bryobacteraceae bacterium]|nr:hypothetical protein [Bryobacterales bacterium]NUN01324.1 hypothetical protein [Bryobacteraceae bacterium]